MKFPIRFGKPAVKAGEPEVKAPVGGVTWAPISTPTNQLFPIWERMLKFAGVIGLILVAAFAYLLWRSQSPQPINPVVKMATARQITSDSGLTFSPVLTHDGKRVIYASDRKGPGNLALWVRPLRGGEPTRITAGEFNESDPSVSPDDSQVVFRSERDGGAIYIAPVAGGQPSLLAKGGWRPRFSPDGKWIAYFDVAGASQQDAAAGTGRVFLISPSRGAPVQIQPQFSSARYPVWAPDGKHLLFEGVSARGAKDWWVTSIEGGEATRTNALSPLASLFKIRSAPDQWYQDKILFSAGAEEKASLWALPLSPSTWEVSGRPEQLTNGPGMEEQCTVDSEGRLVYASLQVSVDIWSLPIEPNEPRVTGSLRPLTSDGARAQLPSVSADGTKLVYISNRSGVRDVWMRDLAANTEQAVTTFRGVGYRPILSTDGTRLAYPTTQNGKCSVAIADLNRPRPATPMGCFSIWDWSPDGSNFLAFRPDGVLGRVEVVTVPSGERRGVLNHPKLSLYAARYSADSHWMAFSSGLNTGDAKVYIAPFHSGEVPQSEWIEITSDRGSVPSWSPDGNLLYFHSNRDGHHCIWARRLDARKHPVGEPISILHLHSVSFGMYLLKASEFHMSMAKDQLVLNLAKDSGNLWLSQVPK